MYTTYKLSVVKRLELLLHVKCWHYYAVLVFPTVHCSGQRLCWSGCGPVCSVAACRLGGNCMAECASSVPLLATRQPRAGHGDPVICRPPCRGHVHWIVSLISSTLYTYSDHRSGQGRGSPVTCEVVRLWSEVPSHWPGLWCNDDVMRWSTALSSVIFQAVVKTLLCRTTNTPPHQHHTTTTCFSDSNGKFCNNGMIKDGYCNAFQEMCRNVANLTYLNI